MKNYKNYHRHANDKILHDAKIISRKTFSGLETEDVIVNNVRPARVFMYDKFSSTQLLKYAIDQDDLLTFGDMIQNSQGQTWLVLKYESDNVLYRKWICKICNFNLKWVDHEKNIQVYPVVLENNSKSTVGEKDDKVMTLPDGRRQIVLRKDENTEKLKRAQRFLIGNEAFEVVDLDAVSEFGLVNLSLRSTQIDPTIDNIPEGIANYYDNQNVYTLECSNPLNMSIDLNQSIQLDFRAYRNGELVASNEIDIQLSNEHIGKLNESFLFTPNSVGTTMITAKYQGQVVQVNLVVRELMVHNYSVEINGPNELYIGEKQKYTAIFKDNGRTIDEIAVFSILADDTKLLKILSSTYSSVEVQANEKMKGNATIHVKSANNIIFGSKTIKIKGYI